MKVSVKSEWFDNGVSVSVINSEINLSFKGVTKVCIGRQSDEAMNLRLYRKSEHVGGITVSHDAVVELIDLFKQHGVYQDAEQAVLRVA